MEIGTSFFAPADKNGKARFGNRGEGAFDHQDLSSTPLVFKRGSSGGHIETTASSSSSSQERVHADISAQIGGKFLGGSGRGQYDSNAAKSAGAIQSSTRVYYHCGRVSLWTVPRLSEKALHILQTAKEPAKSFSATFGDYFVAGYLLGGGNVSMFSGAGGSEVRSKRLNIDVEVHLAFVKRRDKIHEDSSVSAQAAAGTISVYDSLTDQHTEQPISNIDSAFALWEDNKIRAEKLQDRVAAELSKMDLHDDETIIPHTKWFNSFTQQLCIDNAVVSPRQYETEQEEESEEDSSDGNSTEKDTAKVGVRKRDISKPKQPETSSQIAQDVSYKASIIDKVTDVTSEMNINAAFAIKYDAFDAKGKMDFINTSKVKESDISFLFSVKVINQVIYDHTLTEIVPIATGSDGQTTLDAQAFTEIYGDSFISGTLSNGRADVFFTKPKSEEAQKAYGKGKNSFSLNLGFDNLNDNFLRENETTISVTYTGGGQGLKTPEQDWTFETMKSAALRFPNLVAETPMRTHAILTKYTSLRSYHRLFGGISPPAFEVAGVYSMLLQEAYLDYKTVAKDLQVLAFEVSAGKMKLLTSSEYRQQVEEAKNEKAREAAKRRKAVDAINKGLPAEEVDSNSGSETPAPKSNERDFEPPESGQKKTENTPATELEDTTAKKSPGPNHWRPINVTKEYKATLQGLEDARNMVRTFLVRIVQEINILSKHPDLALEDNRVQPHMSPFLFKELLPIGQPVEHEEEEDRELAKVTDQIDKVKGMKEDSI
ncbi:hypothetical protein NM208_g3100 [Fusarium decemcellulare]|uniref:Uncharacterized protein n=1 Tax=Fusarium decemcellulare TaxID=57161 RepID=A0ACC1SQT5_9HYPO|nr:hypothetical protein NM208_g3100 [Fusarium decemcellulare]